jgi:hypothetical protein
MLELGRAILKIDEGLYHFKNVLESTSYLIPLAIKPVFLNGMQNLCEHQLSSVSLVVPFWLDTK